MPSPRETAAADEKPVSEPQTAIDTKEETAARSHQSAPDAEPERTPSEEREPGETSEGEASPGTSHAEAEEGEAGKGAGDAPPLPSEPVPQAEDDGWQCHWDPNTGSWYFMNRFTGKSQWDNPRISTEATAAAPGTQPSGPQPPASEKPPAGGYNPAIHGDYDPNAWYAQGDADNAATGGAASAALGDPYASSASFNRFTGQFQTGDVGPDQHTDEAKSRRQMNAFFDVDAAANSHDGRSLKAERSGKKPSKAELKAFKEKRRARKEEKRRAWLRD